MYKAICRKSLALLLTALMLFSVIPVFSVAASSGITSYKEERLNVEPFGTYEDANSTPTDKTAQDAWWSEYGVNQEGSSLLLNMWNLKDDASLIHHVKTTLYGEGESGSLWLDVYGRLTFDINLDDTAESFELLPGWGIYSDCTVLAQKPGDSNWYIVGRVLNENAAGDATFYNNSLGLTEEVVNNTYKYILANDNAEKNIRLQFIPDNEYGVKYENNLGKISISNIVYSVGIGDGVIDSDEYTVPSEYDPEDYPAEEIFVLGDKNNDGKLDILDLIAVKISLLDNDSYNAVIDMNKDALVNSLDFVELKKNFWDDADYEYISKRFDVKVTEYGALGDGVTNDRAAIQAAIDAANAVGGGTVRLDSGKTFISGNLRMRSNVTLILENGSTLKQSGNPDDFVDVLNNYEPFELTYGLYLDLTIAWNAAAFYNYPFILAPEGTENIKITGNGTIRMDKGDLGEGQEITMQVIGLFKVDNFEISNISIKEYHAFCIKTVSSQNGLYKNVTIDNSEGTVGGTDGINISGSRNIRVTGCTLNTGDDGVYVCSSYNDPRERLWYNNDDPYPCENVEIDNNHVNVIWDETKGFCFIMWGGEYPDLTQVEVDNLYVHDNYFETAGAWTGHWNADTGIFEYSGKCNPIKNVRFENNVFGSIQDSFYTLPISDFVSINNTFEDGVAVDFNSMSAMRNTDFSTEDIYWISRKGGSAGYNGGCGYIDGLDLVDSALYQGINFSTGTNYQFKADVLTSGDPVRLFVKDQITGELIASKECTNTEWNTITLEFSVPTTGDYHIGIERGNATGGCAYIDNVSCETIIEDAAGEADGYTVFSLSDTPDTSGGGNGLRNALGMRFATTTPGYITKVRLYTLAEESGEHLVSIWNYKTGEMLTEEFYTWNIAAGYEGWREFTLPSSVAIASGVEYVVSITTGTDSLYARATDGLASPISNEYIYTFENSGLYSTNAYVSTTTMPDGVTASNYMRDIVFVPQEGNFDVNVTTYGAKGDGVTNDRAAIQAAIDTANALGGGTVRLDAGKTFISGNLRMRSNVTLMFEDGSILKQSGNPDDFVDVLNNYEPFELTYGLYLDLTIAWNAAAFYNYPFILAPEGTENFKITGNGTIRMDKGDLGEGQEITMQVIGLFKVDNFEISDISIKEYHAFCIKTVSSQNGLFKNVTIDNSEGTVGGTDGINISGSRNIRVTECTLNTGDDGVYVCSSYNDPRERLWYNNDDPYPCENVEIDNNHVNVIWDETKGFCFIMWGAEYPDLTQVEVDNLYVHDNYFETAGAWTGHWNADTGIFEYSGKCNPIKNVRFENNTFGTIQDSFYTLPVSDFIAENNKFENGTAVDFDSMSTMKNTDFSTEDIYWISRAGGSAGYNENGYGYIDNLDTVDSALYQGVKYTAGEKYTFTADVKTSGDTVRLFVKDQYDNLIASKECNATDWTTVSFDFTVPTTTNYRIGIERGNATSGYAYIDNASSHIYISDMAGEADGYTVHTTQVPTDSVNGNGLRNALGMRFATTVSGTISKVRLYTTLEEGGEHIVSLWNYSTGERLTDFLTWDITAGYEGWREYSLPSSIAIEPGVEYVISITTGTDSLYAKGTNGLASQVSNEYIYSVATGGLYSTDANTSTTTMPTGTTASDYFRDVVFIPDETGETVEPSEPNDIAGTPVGNTVFTTEAPDTVAGSGSMRNALGMRFGTTVSGTITKVRLYTSAAETGDHYVSIWNYNTGELLTEQIYVWNIISGYEGWREYTLPTAVAIEPGVEYVVSVTAGSDGSYVKGTDGLVSAITNEYLYTVANGGLYSTNAYAATTAMPDGTTASNYFRDVEFIPDETTEPETTESYSVFTTQTPTEYIGASSPPTGLGMKFGVTTAGKITKVRIYTTASETGTHYVALWNYTTGEMLTDQIYQWSLTTTTAGWQEYTLPTAVAVEPGVVYAVSVSAGSDGSFSKEANGLATAFTSGYLYTFDNGGLYTSNGWTSSYAMPESSTASNYMRDVVFVPDETTVEVTPETVFTTQTPTDIAGVNSSPPTGLGMKFGVNTAGTITKVRIYTTPYETGTHYVALWNYTTGELLTDQIYQWSLTTTTAGWEEYTLPTPVAVEPGVVYAVSVSAGSDGSFSKEAGGLATAFTNGNLYTFDNGGLYTSNGWTSSYAMPESSTSSNYMRDVVFVADSEDSSTVTTTTTAIADVELTTYGRTYYADNALSFNWTNSGFAFEIDGTDAYADFVITKNNNRNVYVNVYVDGATEAYKTICLTDSGVYELASGLSSGTHTIKVVKRSESQIGTAAVKSISTSGTITDTPPAKAEKTIEVIGDSITAGFGNLVTDGVGSGGHTSYEQDGTKTYATFAAEQLGAEVSTLGVSGIGSLYIGNGPDCVMQDIYPYVDGLNYNTTTQYDFANNPADVVVIGLGTNDVGHGTDSEVIAAAVEMINMVRQYNPNAVIIWAYGMMIDADSDLFEQAVANVNAAGDDNVYYLQLPLMDTATEGSGVGSHPTVATHERAGGVLADYIAELTGWN